MTSQRFTRRGQRGFTLTELMVAITGGLFVSIAVFALARHGSRFYQREARVANATLANVVGFQRLRADLSRAGFLASPNIIRDPFLCGDPVGGANWTDELKHMAAVRIVPGGSPSNSALTDNNLDPDSVVIAGAFDSAEQFPVRLVQDDPGNTYTVYLQVRSGPLARLGIPNLPTVFKKDRGVRIVDMSGRSHYGTIASVNTSATQPSVTLTDKPPISFRAGSGSCGIAGHGTGALLNVVNFIRYDVRNLSSSASYSAIYAEAGAGPFDGVNQRTELVREELDTSGQVIAGTQEIVSEYAVDLKFGLTVANVNGVEQTLTTLLEGNGDIPKWAGDTTGKTASVEGPQRIRAIRARLSVRSREPDRDVAINAATIPGVAPGLYRFKLAADKYARVRTVQADVTLHNLRRITW